LLSGDELVVGGFAKVFDILYQKWIGESVLSKKNQLCAPRCQLAGYGCSDS